MDEHEPRKNTKFRPKNSTIEPIDWWQDETGAPQYIIPEFNQIDEQLLENIKTVCNKDKPNEDPR